MSVNTSDFFSNRGNALRKGSLPLLFLLFFSFLSCGKGDSLKFTTCGVGGSIPPGANPINISRSPCPSASPAIAQSDGVLYVAWQETQGNSGIYLSRSADGGASFSDPRNISNGSVTTESPAIAADGGNVFLVWDELGGGSTTEVYLKKSTDHGVTFGSALKISDAGGASIFLETHTARSPAVAAIGSTVWVAWEENVFNTNDPSNPLAQRSEILVSVSNDGGDIFTTLPKGISRSSNCSGGTVFPMFSHFPSMVASPTSVYVVWQENTEQSLGGPCNASGSSLNDVFFSKASLSLASPTTFSLPKPVSQTPGDASFPSLAVTDVGGPDIIHVAWGEIVSLSNSEIYYVRSIDGGATFLPVSPLNLSNSLAVSAAPSLAASGEELITTWEEADPDPALRGIVSSTSTNAATGTPEIFTLPQKVSQTSGSAGLPKVLLNLPDVYLVWVDSSTGNPEIVFRKIPF